MKTNIKLVRHEINGTLLFFDVPKSVREKALAHLDILEKELRKELANLEKVLAKNKENYYALWNEISTKECLVNEN